TDNGMEFKNKTLAKFFDEVGITHHFSAARTPQQNGFVERRNRTLVEATRTMLTFANLLSFLWAEAIATACFTQNHSIIHKHFDNTPYELMNKRQPNIKFFRVFGCRCYLLNDYEDVGKLKAKGGIRVFVGYSKESTAFRIYNKRTRKIHEIMNVNFDEISEMASKQFSLELGLSNLNETRKSLNPSVSKVSEASRKDLEDLFQDLYDEYFDSSKIMKSSTMNVETSIIEEVFHEISESFQRESSSSSLNDDVQQSPEEVILPSSNTQSIPINMIPNGDEASTSHNVFNERLEDSYFDAKMASKQFSLEPGLSNLDEREKSSNPPVSKGSEASKDDLEDLFQDFYDEYFDSSKIMKSSATNVETSINEEVFHEVSESFQGESSSSSLNNDVQQSPEEVILPQTNTQPILNNIIPNGDESSTSHNLFNERLEDAYFDANTSFHDPSNVYTFYQPYSHEKKWTKDHPFHKIICDLKSSVLTRGQLAHSGLFSCFLSFIEPANELKL
nr:retrovirus-related Pol polyprotein from transposon TNT 1-94 [Tanacetum cinerariifolium]